MSVDAGSASGAEAVPQIEVRQLSKHFPAGGPIRKSRIHAVEDVSFTLERGEVLAVVGESGSGKSTTARLIARLMAPSAGTILYDGKDVLKSEPAAASLSYRGKVQMVFQDPFSSLNPVHSVRHHLERPMKIHRRARGRRQVRERIHALLASVGLEPAADFVAKYPHQLSGGERQRVALARALAVEPRVLLADEPVSMLDPSIRIGVLNQLARLRDDQGISVLYITHDLASARYIANRTNVMYAGRMIEGAESGELIDHPAHPYTLLLIAAVPNPRANPLRLEMPPRGERPSTIDPLPGCPFAARCLHVMPICREQMPDVTVLSPGHWVRCHLYAEEGRPAAARS